MLNKKSFQTDFLFTRPSFLIGFGNIFNIAGNYFPFNYSQNAPEADYKAIKSDWDNVGNDISNSINFYLNEMANN